MVDETLSKRDILCSLPAHVEPCLISRYESWVKKVNIDELDSIPEDWLELKNPFPELNLEEPEEAEEQSFPHEAQ